MHKLTVEEGPATEVEGIVPVVPTPVLRTQVIPRSNKNEILGIKT